MTRNPIPQRRYAERSPRGCYLFDIDGTLADCSHRIHHILNQPKDWRAFFAACADDKPLSHIVDLAITLHHAGKAILFVSGRSSECMAKTQDWLAANNLRGSALYMRKEGDHRDDDIVKSELLDQILADGWQPIMAFDDRTRVVKMWRARGIPCAQVAEGDF